MRLQKNNHTSRPSGLGGLRGLEADEPMAEINIIPLVDVMLVLLIIFMATTAFVKDSALNLKLPSAKTGQAGPQNSQDLLIGLAQNGKIYLDGQPSDEKTVRASMQQRAKQNAQGRVVIKGDAGIAYARVIRMMDLARQAGLKSVSLGTRQPDDAPQP